MTSRKEVGINTIKYYKCTSLPQGGWPIEIDWAEVMKVGKQ